MKARLRLALGLLLCGATAAGAQTLARKNWAGSGIRVEPWYESAIFYQVDPLTFQDSNGDGFGDLAGITMRLPYLEQLGVDAIVLSPLPLEPPGSVAPIDPVYGSAEDFDKLEREANSHRMRVVIDLAIDAPHEQLIATARFWLSRGVAGLRLVGASADHSQELRELRAIAGPARILIADAAAGPAVASRHPAPRVTPDLSFDQRLAGAQTLTPGLLRAALEGSNLASDAANVKRSSARFGDAATGRIVATALLLGRGAPMLYFGQELGMTGSNDPTPMQWDAGAGFTAATPWVPMGPNAASANVSVEEGDESSLLSWYRKLAQLHHAELAVRTGSLELLPTANANLVAWVRRPSAGNARAVLVVVNLSSYATVTPLSSLLPGRRPAVKMLAKTSSDPEPPGPAAAVALEAFGVYVAALGGGAGLETVVAPATARRRR